MNAIFLHYTPALQNARFYDCKSLLPYLRSYPNFIEVHPFNKKDFNYKNLFVKQIVDNGIEIKP